MSAKLPDRLFKLVLIGDSNVGKSCLITCFSEGKFPDSFVATIGIDFKIKTIECLGRSIKLQIWDTAGAEKFINITGPYYKGANGILILYDITYQESFNNIQNWLRTVDRYASEDVSTFLVGMKCDLEYKRVVPYESGKDLVDRLGMDGFIEVSAQNMINVDECFQMVVKCLLSHEGETRLHIACGKGQTKAVARLLDKKADLEAENPNGKTPLYIACENGHQGVVSLLLAKKANLEPRDISERTPLQIACENGHKDVVSLLLAKKANVEARDSDQRTPLHRACENGHKDVVSLLLAKKANLEARDSNGQTPLLIACDNGHKDIISLLLSNDANLEVRDSNQRTPLHRACRNGPEDVVSLLLSHNADLEPRDSNGKTPLHIACEKSNKDVVSRLLALLLSNNVDLAVRDSNEKTPLHIACENNCKDVVSLLLLNNADLEARDSDGKTPLHIACENGIRHKDVVSLLLLNHANLEARDTNGKTPLHIACENNHKDVVSLLLLNDANLEARDSNRRSPLHSACENRHEDVVSLLLANNADLDARDSNGRTPLHIACEKWRQSVVFLLLANNADLEATDSNGKTPLHIACALGHKDVISLLLAHNANLEARDSEQRTPLYLASHYRRENVVALLWAGNVNFESKDLDQKKAIDFDILLEQACHEWKSDVVERILSLYSNDVNIQFDLLENKTPLHLAAENGDKRIILLLLKNNASLEIMDKDGVKPKDLKIVRECIEMKNQYGGSLKKFSEEIDKQPNKILNRYHQIQLHLKVPKSQPTPSFRRALASVVHTQKRLPQSTGLSLLSENDVQEMIGICEAFLAHKTQIQQVMNLVTHDEALAIACYCWEVPYFIPFRFNEWLHFASERDERERREGMGGYLKLLEGGLKKLSKNLKTNVKVEGTDEEVGCIWLGELLFDLKEQEGIVFPFSRCFYQKTRTWKVIKTEHGYSPSPPLSSF